MIIPKMLLCYTIGIVFLLHNACANPVIGYAALTDTHTGDGVINTLPSLPLEQFGEKLYYFGAIYKGNYYQAMQFCNYNNMQLVSIETKEENDFLWTKFKSFLGWGEYWFWSSGTTMPDNHWVWMSTGKPILYANWLKNAGAKGECLELRYSNTYEALMWTYDNCTEAKHVICEKTVSKTVSKMISSTSNYN